LNNKNNVAVLDGKSSSLKNTHESSYAAVDLGSNSFHLVISRYEHDEFSVVERQKEVVRLAAGLDENNYLSDVFGKS